MNNGLWLLYSFKNDIAVNKSGLTVIPFENGILHFMLPNSYTENNLTIYIKGQIFPKNTDPFLFVKNQYLKKGMDFIPDLDGEFLIIIIDSLKKNFYIATDKLHSKKVFIQETSDFILITDSIFTQVKKEISLDESSLAQYLTSGFVFNSRSLINGINLSKPSTTYTLNNKKLTEKKYWEIQFTNEYSNKDTDKLKQELYDLLCESIKQRNSSEDVLLSLSGGYDAACIQVLLNDVLNKKPHCFCYYAGSFSPDSDAWVANKQAKLFKNPIEFILEYSGDFENFISQNALYGQGISNISFEINTWDYLESKKNENPIYTGEEFFGMRDEKTTNFNDILTRQNFLNWSNIKNSEEIFCSDFIHSSTSKLAEDYKQIESTILKSGNMPFDNQMLLYYNYRMPSVLLNWREFFTGRKNPVELPLLDSKIIEFITKLPYQYRNNKFLFIETLKTYYPSVFKSIERAKKSNAFNWKKIVKENKNFIEKADSENSLLDQYISPLAMTILINKRTVNSNLFYKIIKQLNRKIKLPFVLQPNYYVPDYILILRILVLKRFLKEFEKSQNHTFLISK